MDLAKMDKKSQQVVPAPPLVGVELNPGPGRGHQLSEDERWRVIFFVEGRKKISKKYCPRTWNHATDRRGDHQKVQSDANGSDPTGLRQTSQAEPKYDQKVVRQAKAEKPATEIARKLSR